MQALLDHEDRGAAYRIEVLIVDRPCAAEGRARGKGRAVYRVGFGKPGAGAEVLRLLGRHGVRGVLLAGFLKLLPVEVCRAYRDRILNIHPALLPCFGGKGMYGGRVHQAVLDSGAKLSGPTIHFVNECYDEGRILAQWPVPVLPDDTPQTLAARVLEVEHLLYPAAADALASGLAGGRDVTPRPATAPASADGIFAPGLAAPRFRWPGTGAHGGADLGESIENAFGGSR